MSEKLAYWGSVVFSAIALILIVANISLSNGNRALQQEVSTRAAAINAGQTYARLAQNLVQALGESAVKNDDAKLRTLLSDNGINIKEPVAKAAPAPEQHEKKK
ncbi:MAG: hypothetical protein KGI37_06155 [Alphaproteobacteria bacterium]|nr:hypothetical protein [Alphaproteobacteria bacterium]